MTGEEKSKISAQASDLYAGVVGATVLSSIMFLYSVDKPDLNAVAFVSMACCIVGVGSAVGLALNTRRLLRQ